MSTSTIMTDREKLIELLRRLWEAGDSDSENEILEIVYRHLYQELRQMLPPNIRWQVGEGAASTRFTELLNRFFVKVMESFPNGMGIRGQGWHNHNSSVGRYAVFNSGQFR